MDEEVEIQASDQDEPPWLSELERDVWLEMWTIVLQLPMVLEAQLQRDADLGLFDYMVLARLSMAPERESRMGVLARLIGASMSRLSNVVRRLETQGYVARRPDPANGRFVIATLTTSGYAVVEAAAPGHVRAVRRSVLDPLSPAQVRCLKEIGGRVARQVRSEVGEDPIGLDSPQADDLEQLLAWQSHSSDRLAGGTPLVPRVPQGARSIPQSASSTTTGAWSLAPLPLRSSRSISAPVTRRGQRGGAEHEVDPHALAAGEAQLRVVPVGVDAGAGRVRAGRRRRTRRRRSPRNAARSGGGDVRGVGEDRHVPDVVVLRGDVPVADQRDLGRRVVGQPAGRRRPQRLEPLELVLQVRVGRACGRWARTGSTPGRRRRSRRARAPRARGPRPPSTTRTACRGSRPRRRRCPTRDRIATPFHCE